MKSNTGNLSDKEVIDDALEQFRNSATSLDNALMRFTSCLTTINALSSNNSPKAVTDTIVRSTVAIQRLKDEIDYINNYISRLK